jgi:hypothetical protein
VVKVQLVVAIQLVVKVQQVVLAEVEQVVLAEVEQAVPHHPVAPHPILLVALLDQKVVALLVLQETAILQDLSLGMVAP